MMPAYALIFVVVWWLASRYRMTPLSFAMTFALGQALGDGGLLFFAAAPSMLVFLPFTLVKYQAMTLVPYLVVRERLSPTSSSPLRFPIVVVALVVTYFVAGAVMLSLWARSRWGHP
jgi:hypothetical protein